MIPEDVAKVFKILKDVTSTTAIIGIVLFLVYQNFGEHARAVEGAKASAEESVMVGRAVREALSGHVTMTSEDSSILKMILLQICINTAQGDREQIRQCTNYR